MFEIKTDCSGLDERLRLMLGAIRHAKAVEVGEVLSEWQTEDVHRKRPYTVRARHKGTARTLFRPHSRYEMQHSRRAARRAKRHNEVYRRWSARPIVRVELIKMLEARVQMLVHRIGEHLWWSNIAPGLDDHSSSGDATTSS